MLYPVLFLLMECLIAFYLSPVNTIVVKSKVDIYGGNFLFRDLAIKSMIFFKGRGKPIRQFHTKCSGDAHVVKWSGIIHLAFFWFF